MPPALGRRTPQKTGTEGGRPKRQAVLNRKDTVEIAKGLTSAKPDTSDKNEKKTPNKKETITPKKVKMKILTNLNLQILKLDVYDNIYFFSTSNFYLTKNTESKFPKINHHN